MVKFLEKVTKIEPTIHQNSIVFKWWPGSCSLYYEIIMTIISVYKCTMALALALASVVNYEHKWRHNLEHHLQSSFTIVMYL